MEWKIVPDEWLEGLQAKSMVDEIVEEVMKFVEKG